MTYNFPLDVPLTLVTPHRVINYPVWGGNINGYLFMRGVPRALVLHTPEEEADENEQTPLYFATIGVRRSTHYYADNDGDLYQMVSDKDAAWGQGTHAGNRTWKGRLAGYPTWNPGHLNNNLITLGLEIEGRAATIGSTITPEQFETVAKWIAYKCWQYEIPCDYAHVVRHSDLAADKTDPGSLPVDALIRRARDLMQFGSTDATDHALPEVTPPETEEEVIESTETTFELEQRLRLAWHRGRVWGQEFTVGNIAETETVEAFRLRLQARAVAITDRLVNEQIEDLLP